jgi:hypothetical protein
MMRGFGNGSGKNSNERRRICLVFLLSNGTKFGILILVNRSRVDMDIALCHCTDADPIGVKHYSETMRAVPSKETAPDSDLIQGDGIEKYAVHIGISGFLSSAGSPPTGGDEHPLPDGCGRGGFVI